MACGTMMQRTKGIKKQMNELIAQTYQRGYKAGRESGFEEWTKTIDINSLVKQGRNEAWEAARYCVNIDEAREYNYAFDGCIAKEIFEKYTASEAIEKLRAYEEQEKQEEDKFHVGDEVILDDGEKAVVTEHHSDRICCVRMDGCTSFCFVDSVGKTGRHFPEIAEVLKKMQEDKNGN